MTFIFGLIMHAFLSVYCRGYALQLRKEKTSLNALVFIWVFLLQCDKKDMRDHYMTTERFKVSVVRPAEMC